MFLVDTNVISDLGPLKPAASADLIGWFDRASPFLYLSAVTAAEVGAGIAKAERLGASRKALLLQDWWAAILHLYGERILPFDLRVAAVAGRILDRARAHDSGFEDIAIAATAELHGLTMLTRNERHFGPLGVPVVNPFRELPALPG